MFMASVHHLCIPTNKGPQVVNGGGKCELDWPRRTYQQAVENGEDVVEKDFGRHDGSKSMARDAVALGEREQMDDSGPPVPILRRVEQMMRYIGRDEIPVCFVEDEGNISGFGEFCERTQEFWGIDSTGLRVRSGSPSYRDRNTYRVIWTDEGNCFGLFRQKQLTILDFWVETSRSERGQRYSVNS